MKAMTMLVAGGVLLLAAIAVSAVMLSPDGTGQALIYPVYSVNETGPGQALDTLVVVNNEHPVPKAVRVTLREADVGHPVLQFNVYLGPLDSWSFALSAGQGQPELITEDGSCTEPAIPQAGRIALSTVAIEAAADGVAHDPAARLAHGYLEVIEFGVLTGVAAVLATPPVEFGRVGEPNCEALRARWETGGAWDQDPGFELDPPDGGLSGQAWLIDVLGGHAYDYAATALARFSAQVLHRAADVDIGLDAVNAPDPKGSGMTLATLVTPDGPVDLLWDQPIDAVTSVLMTEALSGDVSIDPALGARTEMVISLPTKRHYVFAGHAGNQPVPRPPFANPTGSSGTYSGTLAVLIDRAGHYEDLSNTCLDPPPPPPGLNWAVQSFGDAGLSQPAPITGAANHVPVFTSPPEEVAKLRVSFTQSLPGTWWCGDTAPLNNPGLEAVTAGGEAVLLPGLPALGVTLQRVSNNTVSVDGERVLSNYGASFPARREPRLDPIEQGSAQAEGGGQRK